MAWRGFVTTQVSTRQSIPLYRKQLDANLHTVGLGCGGSYTQLRLHSGVTKLSWFVQGFPGFSTGAPASWDGPSAPGKQGWLVTHPPLFTSGQAQMLLFSTPLGKSVLFPLFIYNRGELVPSFPVLGDGDTRSVRG